MQTLRQPEYSTLAKIYDSIMEDVDYEVWADFIDEIIQVHHPHPQTVLELACGTGSLAFALAKIGCYQITGTDKSEAMIEVARKKAHHAGIPLQFQQMDFLQMDLHQSFDIIVSIFDSINYLEDPGQIKQMLGQLKKLMKPKSLFIFDFTTPKNSLQAIHYLNDEEGTAFKQYKYFQKSWYDAKQQIHYNTFDIKKFANDQQTVLEHVTEEHHQRIYTLQEMQAIVADTDFQIVAQYGEFDLDKATDKNLRITMVLQCPDIP